MDKKNDAQAIADGVNALDVHDRVGNLKAIINGDFKTEPVEDGTGNPFKQSAYDGTQKLEPYTKAADKVEVLQTAAKLVGDNAIAEGNDWLQADLNDFSRQIETTFLDEDEDIAVD